MKITELKATSGGRKTGKAGGKPSYVLRSRRGGRGQRGVAAVAWAAPVFGLIRCSLVGFEESPVGQTVVNGNDDRVFEKFGGNHQQDHEEAPRGQVSPAHLQEDEKASENTWNAAPLIRVLYPPGDLRSSDRGGGHVVVLFLLLFVL